MNFLVESREEQIEGSFTESIASGSLPPGDAVIEFTPERSQSVDSIYAEALIPLFSADNAVPGVKSLDLQLSVRYDDYETVSPDENADVVVESRGDPIEPFDTNTNNFSSTDYTVGVRYQPIDDIILRGSYSTGFVPPNVTQIFQTEIPGLFSFIIDPQRSFFFGPIDTTLGGNPDLRPEESESWSVGTIVEPSFIPGFRLSVDYTLIEKEDEIAGITAADLLNLEGFFPGRVTRGELTPADEAQGFTAGPVLALNTSAINLAFSSSEAIDIQIDQSFESDRYGLFKFYALATHLLKVDTQILPESDVRDRVGFDDGPLEWRGNFGLTWTSPADDWVIGWNAQYYHDYLVYSSTASDSVVEDEVRNHGQESIPSEVYHDLRFVYRPAFDSSRFNGLLDGVQVSLGIQNVFDKEPELRPAGGGFDLRGQFSPYGDVRGRRYSVTLRKSF